MKSFISASEMRANILRLPQQGVYEPTIYDQHFCYEACAYDMSF